MARTDLATAFEHRVVAVPETRQLDVLADMLEKRGATVLRCPMIAIKDAPDAQPILDWLDRVITDVPDLMVLYTGEGIERLLGFAERSGRKAEFVEALARMTKLCRGPKPKRALRRLDLSSDIDAAAPTTSGIIETLKTLDLAGKRVAIQLYGDQSNPELEECLASLGAKADFVWPYVYASAADDQRVIDLISSMRDGEIDAITFTSNAQVKRLLALARDRQIEHDLELGLKSTCVAAVGPVVAQTLAQAGIAVDAMPTESFFMKPLVTALANKLNER